MSEMSEMSEMSGSTDAIDLGPEVEERGIRAVRIGHGANCSSIGSVIDTLFASAVVGAAIFAAIAGALKTETATVVGQPPRPPEPDEGAEDGHSR